MNLVDELKTAPRICLLNASALDYFVTRANGSHFYLKLFPESHPALIKLNADETQEVFYAILGNENTDRGGFKSAQRILYSYRPDILSLPGLEDSDYDEDSAYDPIESARGSIASQGICLSWQKW